MGNIDDRMDRIEQAVIDISKEMRIMVKLQERQINLAERQEQMAEEIRLKEQAFRAEKDKVYEILREHGHELAAWRMARSIFVWGLGIISTIFAAAAIKYFNLV